MEEKIQEMLKAINDKYDDFEIESVDLSLVRKLENLANKVSSRSLLRKLYFKYYFVFFITNRLVIASELYLTINKDERKVEYEIGRIYEPLGLYRNHALYFKFDIEHYPSNNLFVNRDVGNTKETFEKVIREEKLLYYYREHLGWLELPLNVEILQYSFL
jgi:hypothetical protein